MKDFLPVELLSRPGVAEYKIREFIHSQQSLLLKLRIVFADKSVLVTTERVDARSRKYSFHWQRADNTVIMRWDNSPHHRHLVSFPHHKHDYRNGSDNLTDSHSISLSEVLDYIQNQLTLP